jgi:hypothetical protein
MLLVQVLSWFWSYYITSLAPLASIHVQQIYLIEFSQLPWQSWQPTKEVLLQVRPIYLSLSRYLYISLSMCG